MVRIPAHIDRNDLSAGAWRARAEHRMSLMALSPKGHGFRTVHDESDKMSIVEQALVKAGDMKPPVKTRSKRKPRKQLWHH